MREELKPALELAKHLPAEEIPRLVGDLEEIRITALSRLTTPAAPTPHDELLKVAEAARRLGMSSDFLYHNSKRYPFTRRQGRALRFSANGIEAYLRRSR